MTSGPRRRARKLLYRNRPQPGKYVHPIRRQLAFLLALGLSGTLAACGGDGVVLPGENMAATIKAAGGDGQTGPAGLPLGQAAVVQVTDEQGRPVEGQEVVFTALTPGAVSPQRMATDARGQASTEWTLGAAAGTQQLRAEVAADGSVFTTLNATAVAGAGQILGAADGDAQIGPVGSALAESLVVRVTDGQGNPVAGVTVSWTAGGGGSVSPESAVTGADGRAAAERVLGPVAGPQTADASAEGLAGSPVTFHHTAEAAVPTRLVLVSGDAQSAPAGFPLADSLVVRLVDDNGNGVGGKPVTWLVAAGSGTVSAINTTTTAQGYAQTRWTLGPTVGQKTLNAVFSGVPAVPFTAMATADVPARLAKQSGDGQTATVGANLGQPLAVRVTDANDNPVANVGVTWTAVGGGSVSATSSGTDDAGIARITRTLGSMPGTYTTTAAVEGLQGSPVTFTSEANPGTASRLAMEQQPGSTAQSGLALNPRPSVRLEDAQGNPVQQGGVPVTVTVNGGATLGGTVTRNTNGSGIAVFAGLSISGTTGTAYVLSFSAPGLTDADATPVTLSAGPADSLMIMQQPAASAQSGVPLDPQPVIQVTDASGNPVSVAGRTITVSVSSGLPAALSNATAVTDDQGRAAFDSLTLSGFPGDRRLLFSSNNLANAESDIVHLAVAPSPAATTTTITSDGPDPSDPGTPVTVTFTVASAAGTPGGNVTVSASTGESCSATVADGQCLITLNASGPLTLTANYAGTPQFAVSSSDPEAHTVN